MDLMRIVQAMSAIEAIILILIGSAWLKKYLRRISSEI